MAGRALKMAFWICYDHLGTLLLLNLLAVAILAFPAALLLGAAAADDPVTLLAQGGIAGLLLLGVAGPVALVGFLAWTREVIDERHAGFGAYLQGIRRHGLRAAALGTGYTLAAACLAASAWFYPVRLGADWPWLGYGLGALACWALAFLLATGPLAFAALVFRRAGLRAALRLGVLLALANPGLAMALVAGTAAWLMACLAPPVLVLFSIAPVAVGWACAYELLARRHAEADPAQPAPPRDAEDDFLNRGWRDALFPWKM